MSAIQAELEKKKAKINEMLTEVELLESQMAATHLSGYGRDDDRARIGAAESG